jgi:hypothetical protein
MIPHDNLVRFLRESLAIEDINRDPTPAEIEATKLFISLPAPTIAHIRTLVGVFEPDAQLREFPGMDVRVGTYYPPRGGEHIPHDLRDILNDMPLQIDDSAGPFNIHHRYEQLHPFTDCNGRSGRIIWAWMMNRQGLGSRLPYGFLRHWYYQSLAHAQKAM